MTSDSAPKAPSVFRVPPTIRLGEGAHRAVGADVAGLGVSRILAVVDPNVVAQPEVRSILADVQHAGVTANVYEGVTGEPTTEVVDAGGTALRTYGAEAVLAIGGGSVLDTGKAIAALATNPGRIGAYSGRDRLVNAPIPLIAVATTAGTGSEVTRYTVITDHETGVKMLLSDWRLLPRVAVADPLLTLAMPGWVTASTGIDALTHAIEAYVSRQATPMSDVFALAAIREIAPHLPIAWERGEIASRAAMVRGAVYAGIAFSNASVALVHGMSRPIGAHFHVPHGLANAILLSEVMAFSLVGAPERYRDIGSALGAASGAESALAAARAAAESVAQLCRQLQIPRLSQFGVDAVGLKTLAPRLIADARASGSPANNPRLASDEEILGLYLRCL